MTEEVQKLLSTKPRTVEEASKFAAALNRLLKSVLGPRSTGIVMIGFPIDGEHSEHDRFAAHVYGPCLSARGLLAWGSDTIKETIDKGDSSKNGNHAQYDSKET